MRLEITRRADLATRALRELGQGGRKMKSSELAERVGTTPGFLSQALAPLVTRGWVRSEPGPAGGYLPTIGLDEVSVLDVIEAIEGPTQTGKCVLEDRPCAGGERCALHQPWSLALGQLVAELAATPLSAAGTREKTS